MGVSSFKSTLPKQMGGVLVVCHKKKTTHEVVGLSFSWVVSIWFPLNTKKRRDPRKGHTHLHLVPFLLGTKGVLCGKQVTFGLSGHLTGPG